MKDKGMEPVLRGVSQVHFASISGHMSSCFFPNRRTRWLCVIRAALRFERCEDYGNPQHGSTSSSQKCAAVPVCWKKLQAVAAVSCGVPWAEEIWVKGNDHL